MILSQGFILNLKQEATRVGFGRALFRSLYYALNERICFRRFEVIHLAHENLTPLNPARYTSHSSRLATAADLRSMLADGNWELSNNLLRGFEAGDSCLLSYVGDKLAGYTWIHSAQRPCLVPGLQLILPDGYLYNFAGFTLPQFRGHGIQPYRHHQILDRPEWRFKKGMIGYVEKANWSSKRGQAKSGYQPLGTITLIGTRSHYAAFFSSSLKRFGIRRIREGQSFKKLLKAGYRFVRHELPYGILLYRYGINRQRALLKKADRSQSHTYTCFYRSPGQLDALTGPVMDRLLANRPSEDAFRINVFASSNGAESYTLASALLRKFPALDFHVYASDLHQELLERATLGLYTREEVYGGAVPERFVSDTFDKTADGFQVKAEVRKRVTFRQANLLDPELGRQFMPADIVLAQNVFFHLDQELARKALRNVLQFLKPRSALFIDGMELDMRVAITSEAGLTPLDYRCKEIHEHARKHIGERWWNYYYGMEPYVSRHPARLRRFSTIFFKGN